MNFIWFDILIAVCYLYYGYKFLKNPPEFNGNDGIATKRTKKSPEAWAYGNRISGIYCISCGIVCAIFTAIQHFVFKDSAPSLYIYITYFIEFAFIALFVPIINLLVKKKFGD